MREEIETLPSIGAGEVPISIWMPDDRVRGVVLMGHGLGVDRHHVGVLAAARILADVHEIAVVAPDLPLHGARKLNLDDPSEIVARWESFWSKGGVQLLRAEWTNIFAHGRRRFPDLPFAYFGLSLGTQYGLVFLATTPEIQAAVLGLFGSKLPPKTPVMNACAPRVRCPVYFIQKRDDEIHPLPTSRHLFDSLGSTIKSLDSSPGRHADVGASSFENACRFIANHI